MVITGNATTAEGNPVDFVRVFIWPNGALEADITPDPDGNWSFSAQKTDNYGITYIAEGCQPVTHGPYFLTAPALGGDMYVVTIDGQTYRVHEFLSSGELSIEEGVTATVLLVGGGGSGGGNNTGGGGGGGAVLVEDAVYIASGTHGVLVGAGGVSPGAALLQGNNGENTVAFGLTAQGGGGGGAGNSGSLEIYKGLDGGNGGGGGGSYRGSNSPGGDGIQGYSGGTGLDTLTTRSRRAGGGGGAGGVGEDGADSGNGGPGALVTITGSDRYFGGGGGGGHNGGSTSGGIGGGGDSSGSPESGTPNTGGGGGGMRENGGAPGSGGSGIVIIRYPV
jgi:hypothetical protein